MSPTFSFVLSQDQLRHPATGMSSSFGPGVLSVSRAVCQQDHLEELHKQGPTGSSVVYIAQLELILLMNPDPLVISI